MKHLKFTLYPVLILLLLGIAAIGLGFIRFTWVDEDAPDVSSLPGMEPQIEPTLELPEMRSPTLPTISPTPTPEASPSPSLNPEEVAAQIGVLRVSNPTDHPVRLALLEQPSSGKSYGKPAHWDFAPMEGGGKGLVLSLSQDSLKVKKGDILVAFAQDGSRLYWGPFIVGKTPVPMWNKEQAEWELVLQ
jgi:hypothetical protein